MKISITTLGLIFFLSGCGLVSHFKMLNAFESETISIQPFKKVIPFQEVNGFIIIEIEIAGIQGNFIFDTGATTKLDLRLASKLKAERLGKVKTVDSNGRKKHLQYVVIDELKIENVSFYDIVASISSLEKINSIACINVSGIIGANAMNKCIWQIDYKAKEITFTNQRDSLNLNQENKSYFSVTGKGVPTISIYSNDRYCGQTIFDTGFNGGINMAEIFMLPNSKYIESQTFSWGSHGTKLRNQKLATYQSVELNKTISLNNQIVSFEKNPPFGFIGNKFLKNYKVTFDWINQEFFLDQYEGSNLSQHKGLGFSLKQIDNKVTIGSIIINSEAYKLGLRLNDTVIKINDIDFSDGTYKQYCEYLSVKDSWDMAELIIERENQQLPFKVERKNLMEQIE